MAHLKTIFSLSVQPVQGRADGDGLDRDWRRRDGPRRLHRESSRQFDDGNHQGIDDAIKLIFATTDGVPLLAATKRCSMIWGA